MRLLIDGYNLLHAVVPVGRKLGPDGLRQARRRLLNELAGLLGAIEAHQTTVVFDAAAPADHLPAESSHKGITVVFAVGDENADERIERLIARHSAPKALTVVSSDHRVRRAAGRRRATAVGAGEFWDRLQSRPHPGRAPAAPAEPPPDELERLRCSGPGADEAEYWAEQFRDVVESDEARELSRHADFVPTDEEIARIAREVEQEFRTRRP